MSSTFFFCVFFSAAAFEWFSPNPLFYGSTPFPKFSADGNVLVLIFSIFISNIVLSAFIFVTLPGFAFSPLSSVVLVYKAYIWGCSLAYLPTYLLLMALPTMILEGLGYCFAASAGTIVGLSWLKPKWAYGNESLKRIEAIKKAFKESLAMLIFVSVFLFFSAIIEAATFMMI
jgi:hypothetical protein